MVGPPKSLLDLRRLEANLRVTCRGCGRVTELDREALAKDLMLRHKNLAWDAMPAHFRCSVTSCRSKNVRLSVVPFGSAAPRLHVAERFVAAAEELMSAVQQHSGSNPALQRMSAARLAYEEAKAALLVWAETLSEPTPR